MRRPWPGPIAFCWLHGHEMGKRDIEKYGCTDPIKQTYGICEHIQFYGEKKEAMDPVELQKIYDNMVRDLAKQGVRLEGRDIKLVQAMPGGCRVRLPFDEAEKARRDKLGQRSCI